METLKTILDNNEFSEVFFGSLGFYIAKSDQINEMQLGYSVHPDGNDLSGTNEGDWIKEWIVIGHDTELGDPFFVDSRDQNFPVYTAMHGMGTWDPYFVSNSLKSFI